MRKTILLLLLAFTFGAGAVNGQTVAPSSYNFSGPYSYKNLDVFLVQGADCGTCFGSTTVLTLDEALEKKIVTVFETQNVNELAIQNESKTEAVFIQAGDIVKGGQQDRVLGQDLLLQPASGKVQIGAFCVEHGRWQKRGGEDVKQFSSSKNRISSKELKVATTVAKDQSGVWTEVAQTQSKLSEATGKTVNNPDSASSLQLALEDKDLNQKINAYQTALAAIIEKSPQSLGYVFFINGKLNSGDVYATHELFKKLWPKLLLAMSQEAFAESNPPPTADLHKETVTADYVKHFMVNAESCLIKETDSLGGTQNVTCESKTTVLIESRAQNRKTVSDFYHRSYLSK